MALPRGFRIYLPSCIRRTKREECTGSELPFRNSGWAKYKISVFGPEAKMKPAKPVPSLSRYTSMALPRACLPISKAGIVGFKKFFIYTNNQGQGKLGLRW